VRLPRPQIRSLCLVWLSFAPILSCQSPPHLPEHQTESRASLALVRSVLEEAVERGQVSGVVGLVARDGKVVFREAFGWKDIEDGSPMTEDTIFRIASMTKPITGVAVMMLHDRGRLHIDDPIARFIPEFQDPDIAVPGPDGGRSFGRVVAQGEITIRHLLTHTSGISYRFSGVEPLTSLYAEAGISDGLVQTEGTVGQGVRRLASLPLLHEPGSGWKYGLSTDVLGHLVEVVSGRTLEEFFEESIFQPLGMKDTHFFLPEEKIPRLASVYRRAENGRLRELPEGPIQEGPVLFSTSYHYRGPRTYFSGGAGLVSTADDYFRFCQMLLNGGELEGVRLLRAETVELMTRNQVGELSVGEGKFGFGLSIPTDGSGALGWGGFFFTRFWLDPEQEIIGVFMSQLWPNQRSPVDDAFRRAADEWIRTDPTRAE